MGMIERIFDVVFGGNRNVVREAVEIFCENAETGAQRSAQTQAQAMTQYGAEFAVARAGWFDRFMDGVNRLPRPMLALGTLGLFVSAMVNPLWFAQRMQGIALVPEPLWWLLGVIVSFYFCARHQIKSQEFTKQIVGTMAQVPQVIRNIQKLQELRSDSIRAADTRSDARLEVAALKPTRNAALEDWQKQRG